MGRAARLPGRGEPGDDFVFPGSLEGGGSTVEGEAGVRERSMDVIVFIDDSGSMDTEIEEVRRRIEQSFDDVLEA